MNEKADYDQLVKHMTMTPAELVEEIVVNYIGMHSLCESDYDQEDIPGGFSFESVYEEGGYEGGGEHAEHVFKVTNPALDGFVPFYFRTVGFYSSYNGTDWNDSFTIVEPREVVVTQYFPVGK
jgi:hypothetical protein